MIKLSERTRRGLGEAIGTPTFIGGLALAILIVIEVANATMG